MPDFLSKSNPTLQPRERDAALTSWSLFLSKLHKFCTAGDIAVFGTICYVDVDGGTHADPAQATATIQQVLFDRPTRKGVWDIELFVRLNWRVHFDYLLSQSVMDVDSSDLAMELQLRKQVEPSIAHLSFLYSSCKCTRCLLWWLLISCLCNRRRLRRAFMLVVRYSTNCS